MKNPFVLLLIGLAMVAAGLFWLTAIVQVSTVWGAGIRIGAATIPSGLTLVPLIVSIIWIFFNPKSLGAKLLCVISGIILIAAILMSVRFHVSRVSLYEFILIFIFIAGGAGFVGRGLFSRSNK